MRQRNAAAHSLCMWMIPPKTMTIKSDSLFTLHTPQIPPQRRTADAQLAGGCGTVAVVGGDSLLHDLGDNFVQRTVAAHLGVGQFGVAAQGALTP